MTNITTGTTTAVYAPSLSSNNGQITTTSTQIAEHFGKRHDTVLRAIDNLECSAEYRLRNFAESSVEGEMPNGGTRTYRTFNITRDGFVFLAMGFTGKEAAQWKEAYITAFNKMESEIAAPALISDKITPAQAQHLRELVQLVVETGQQTHGETWTRLHRKMKTNSYLALRPDQFDAACEYLRGKFDGESIASLIQKHLPALPAPATTENAMPTTQAPSLKNRRWLVYFDHTGREHHEAVPNDAMVCSPKEIPGMLLNERNGIFSARDVMEIAGHANLRMMSEICTMEAQSKAKAMRDEIKTFGTTDLSEFAKSAYLELSLRGEFKGAAA